MQYFLQGTVGDIPHKYPESNAQNHPRALGQQMFTYRHASLLG